MNPQTTTTPSLEYRQYEWGDRIVGTKAELQSLGIGVGIAFPGEDGANKREMTTKDPRGYRVKVYSGGDDRFIASLIFPNWPKEPRGIGPEVEAFPGVQRQEFYVDRDRYIGTAEALVAAGLVAADRFPGMPGMRKGCVWIYADGSLPPSQNRTEWVRSREPGARYVERVTRDRYSVIVRIAEDEAARRSDALARAKAEWRAALAAMPRPAPLLALPELTRQFGRPAQFVPDRSVTVVSLAAWREMRRARGAL